MMEMHRNTQNSQNTLERVESMLKRQSATSVQYHAERQGCNSSVISWHSISLPDTRTVYISELTYGTCDLVYR